MSVTEVSYIDIYHFCLDYSEKKILTKLLFDKFTLWEIWQILKICKYLRLNFVLLIQIL